MHTINLTLNCKTATGDDVKIVSMNNDYIVNIIPNDCGTFTDAPFKRLVIRHDREYREVDIVTRTLADGSKVYEATLPPIPYNDYVDLGVCGKLDANPTVAPVYTSTSARYECSKSILAGTVVHLTNTKLVELNATSNGEYDPANDGADGYSKVTVKVTNAGATEERSVSLSMKAGDQVILPSNEELSMSKVIVRKPSTLTPGNIRKGVSIGGVDGEYEKVLRELRISEDGEYTSPPGVDGFSKVTVSVGKSSRERTMRVGHSFTYEYNASAAVELSTSDIVTKSDNGKSVIITATKIGNCIVTIKDYDGEGNLLDTVHYSVSVTAEGDATHPVEVDTDTKMKEYLTKDKIGGVLKYVGNTTEDFVNNAYYLIEEV